MSNDLHTRLEPGNSKFGCGSFATGTRLLSCGELGLGDVLSSSTSIPTKLINSSTETFAPSVRSGSHTDTGPRNCNEDEHICIDDLPAHLGSPCGIRSLPSSFYAVFDGHGGYEAASYVKNNARKLFFEDSNFPLTSDIDDATLLEKLENSHRKAFLLADQALANKRTVRDSCGTTALTALVLGSHLLVANAGDCRAVLCRKGVPVQMSQDHKATYLPEQRRVEELGGFIKYEYFNGELAVTRALGDWCMKFPFGSASPLTADPDIKQIVPNEDDEFLIIGCDGIWDVMSNEDAVSLVRRELRRHDDPQECARELVNQALRMDTSDNLTAIVVCFSSPPVVSKRPRLRCCTLSKESRSRLKSLLEDK
ncbi:hypothetical protein LguiB_014767 [Lonicera macranthoides]